jgi:hypothetical protein
MASFADFLANRIDADVSFCIVPNFDNATLDMSLDINITVDLGSEFTPDFSLLNSSDLLGIDGGPMPGLGGEIVLEFRAKFRVLEITSFSDMQPLINIEYGRLKINAGVTTDIAFTDVTLTGSVSFEEAGVELEFPGRGRFLTLNQFADVIDQIHVSEPTGRFAAHLAVSSPADFSLGPILLPSPVLIVESLNIFDNISLITRVDYTICDINDTILSGLNYLANMDLSFANLGLFSTDSSLPIRPSSLLDTSALFVPLEEAGANYLSACSDPTAEQPTMLGLSDVLLESMETTGMLLGPKFITGGYFPDLGELGLNFLIDGEIVSEEGESLHSMLNPVFKGLGRTAAALGRPMNISNVVGDFGADIPIEYSGHALLNISFGLNLDALVDGEICSSYFRIGDQSHITARIQAGPFDQCIGLPDQEECLFDLTNSSAAFAFNITMDVAAPVPEGSSEPILQFDLFNLRGAPALYKLTLHSYRGPPQRRLIAILV